MCKGLTLANGYGLFGVDETGWAAGVDGGDGMLVRILAGMMHDCFRSKSLSRKDGVALLQFCVASGVTCLMGGER